MDSNEYIKNRFPSIKKEDIPATIGRLFGFHEVPDVVLQGQCPLLEKVLSPSNLSLAMQKVLSNNGAPGIDGMTPTALSHKFKEQASRVLRILYSGEYVPQPVLRRDIPKADGSTRHLGIPCAVDRLIQQAIVQVLTKIIDSSFSDYSYGFRQGKSSHDAVKQVLNYANSGKSHVVKIDIEQFFDNVDHSILLSILHHWVNEDILLTYIERYLKAGVIINKIIRTTNRGVPQGGPLSPLLSNLVLNELDQMLEKHSISFVRYADDLILLTSDEAAAQKAFEQTKSYLVENLKLLVNANKTIIGDLSTVKFLGFTFNRKENTYQLGVPQEAYNKLNNRLKAIKGGVKVSPEAIVRGWTEYYAPGLDSDSGLSK